MAYKEEFQSNNADLQTILNTINAMSDGYTVTSSSFVPTNSGSKLYKKKFKDNNIDLQKLLDMALMLPLLPSLITVTYNANGGTFTNGTSNVVEYERSNDGLNTMTVVSGTEEIPVHSNEDYIFIGWYLDEDCTDGKELILKNVQPDSIIYAKWEVKLDDALVASLIDFNYTNNKDGTVTITSWKGTLNGASSTEIVIPDDNRIIL